MAKSNWTLVDRTDRTYVEQLEVTPESVGGKARDYRIYKHRLNDGLSAGVDVIHIDNGTLRFDILPSRGMGLWKAWLGDQQIGWNSPVKGPVHPAFVPLADPSGLGWLDGFDELLARCGLESNGAPDSGPQGQLAYGLHGRIANKPAHQVKLHVDGETGEIQVTGVVDEVRIHFFKLRLTTTIKTAVGQNAIEIRDVVENLSASSTDIQLLYHINLGAPLLEPGASVVLPVHTLMPRNQRAAEGIEQWSTFGQPTPGYVEQVYFCDLQADAQNRTEVLLKNAASSRAVSVQFNTQQLPCFSLWKNQIAEADGYVTGLEPATNYPNPHSFEKVHNRVVPLAPRASRAFELRLEAHADPTEVAAAEQRINGLRAREPVVHDRPQLPWCSEV